MADQGRAQRYLGRIGAFIGWSFVAAVAAGLVPVSHMRGLDQDLGLVIGGAMSLGVIGLPVALAGGLVALALQPFKHDGLWPLLAACGITVLAAAAFQLEAPIMGPMGGSPESALFSMAAVFGFVLQSHRGGEKGDDVFSDARRKVRRRTIIWIVLLTVLLGLGLWASVNVFFPTDHYVREYWSPGDEKELQLERILNWETIGYAVACAALIWRSRVSVSRSSN